MRRPVWGIVASIVAVLTVALVYALMSRFTPRDRSVDTRRPAGDVSLAALLRAEDLDELFRVRHGISSLTSEESLRIASVIRDWTDRQAIANLLFSPDLIPISQRFDAIDRALNSHDVPYYAIAAVVGLQEIALDEVPADKRGAWEQMMLDHVQSTSKVLAGRASVTLYIWARADTTSDLLPQLVSLYPVADEGASRNIIAAALAASGDLPADEFARRLEAWRIPPGGSAALRAAHEKYREAKARDAFDATLMSSPVYAYIPNLSEVSAPEHRSLR